MASSSKRPRQPTTGAPAGSRPRAVGAHDPRNRGVFEHPQARVFFDAECKGKRIQIETTLDTPEALFYGNLADPIRHNNWAYFTQDMDFKLSRNLVWEFFANAHYKEVQSPGCRKSWVRGVEISYDAETIASVLGLPFYPQNTDFVDMYNRGNINKDDLDTLKNALFIPGKDWNYGRNHSIKHVYAKYLDSHSRFWMQFVCHNLYPQSHLTECKPHILRIVYGIRQLYQVDAAWLMSTYLFHRAREAKPGSFGLPWVIHKLCHEAGVNFQGDIRDLQRTPRLTLKSWEGYSHIASRVRHEDEPDPANEPNPAPAPVPPAPAAPAPPRAPEPSELAALSSQMARLLRRQSRQNQFLRAQAEIQQARDEQLRAQGCHIPYMTPEQIQLLYSSSSSEEMHDAGGDSS